MANITKIKLPSGTTYDLRDSSAVTTTSIADGTHTSIMAGDSVKLYTNNEGGNIQIKSPSGYVTELDSYNDSNVRILSYDESGQVHSVTWSRGTNYNLDTMNSNINGKVSKSGDTMTGELAAPSYTLSDNKVKLYSDGEGGNIRILSKSGYVTEFDRYNDTNCRIYSYDSNNTIHSLVWSAGKNYNLNSITKDHLVVTRVKVFEGSIAPGNIQQVDVSVNVTSGYLPLSSTGFVVNGTGKQSIYIREVHINNRTNGSCTVVFCGYNAASVTLTNMTLWVDILSVYNT